MARAPAKPKQQAAEEYHDSVNGLQGKDLEAVEKRLDDHINSTNGRFDTQTAMLNQVLTTLQKILERLQKIEVDNIGTVLTLQNQTKDALEKAIGSQNSVSGVEKKADDLKSEIPEKLRQRLEKIEEVLPGILLQNKIMIFIASAIALALMGLLWAVFTGQASIIFTK